MVNATRIEKTLRSTRSPGGRREYLHVIKAPTVRGELVYTKGKLVNDQGIETYFLFVSAKLPSDR